MRYIFLILPSLVACLPPIYNHIDPRLAGFPTFYWMNLALIVASALGIYVTYRLGVK